jgi:hypothetical protein
MSKTTQNKKIQAILVEQGILQRIVNTYMCLVDNFRYLSHIGDKKHTWLRQKHTCINKKKTWRSTLLKFDG